MKLLPLLLALISAPLATEEARRSDERSVDVLYVPAEDPETEWVYTIPESALDRSPSWDPDEADPPLSPSKAVKIARAALDSETEAGEYLLSSIHLDAVHGREKEVWYYMIEFYEVPEWPTFPRSKRFLILLDGSVVPPESRPRSVPRQGDEVP